MANEWKLNDLRKIALLICETVLSHVTQARDVCKALIKKIVERDGSDKVMEFMEIQLMHSNDVFLRFTDWFQNNFKPKQTIVPLVDTAKAMPDNNQ